MIPANTLWVLVFVIVVVYLVARWVRSHTATEDEQREQVRYLIRSSNAGAAEYLGEAKDGLTVSRYYFRETEVETGPPDPADFYDELFVDLRDPDSEQTFQNSIHVATPRALDRVMQEEHWDSVIGTELLIVRRYDLDTILRAAIDHLQEIYEARVQIAGKGPGAEPVG
jgi:hypothetical protein